MAKVQIEASFPGAKAWHRTLPVVAGVLACVSTVAVVAAAAFLLRAVELGGGDAGTQTKKDDAIRALTERLAQANPILAQAGKIALVQAKLLELEKTVKDQESAALALKETTAAAVKSAGSAKKAAEIKAAMKKQLQGFAAIAREAEAKVEPLEEERDKEVRELVAVFANTPQPGKGAAAAASADVVPDAEPETTGQPSADAKTSPAEDSISQGPTKTEGRVPGAIAAPERSGAERSADGEPGNGKGVEP